MSSIRYSHPNWSAFYVTLLMHMVTHAHSMESYSYETNSDNTLYLGDVNLLHRCIQDLPAQDNFSSVLTWGKEQGLPIRVTLTPRSMGEVLDPRSMEHSGASLHLSHPLVTPSDPIRPLTDASVCILPSIQGIYSLYSNSYPYLDSCYTSTRLYPPVQGFGLPLDATPSPTPAGDDYEEPQDFFTTQLDGVYWRPAPSPPLAPGRQLDTDLRLAAMSKDTDGLDIHSDQFVLEYLRRGVLGSNWTTSLPVEDWFCPNCKASGITAIPAGRIPETPQKEPNLFPTPQTRSRDRAALACDKMLVIKQVRVQGGLDKAVWGTASFQGPLSRPW
eukprot:gene26232-biopygen11169